MSFDSAISWFQKSDSGCISVTSGGKYSKMIAQGLIIFAAGDTSSKASFIVYLC